MSCIFRICFDFSSHCSWHRIYYAMCGCHMRAYLLLIIGYPHIWHADRGGCLRMSNCLSHGRFGSQFGPLTLHATAAILGSNAIAFYPNCVLSFRRNVILFGFSATAYRFSRPRFSDQTNGAMFCRNSTPKSRPSPAASQTPTTHPTTKQKQTSNSTNADGECCLHRHPCRTKASKTISSARMWWIGEQMPIGMPLIP